MEPGQPESGARQRQRHYRQIFWQIYLPICVLVLAAMFVLFFLTRAIRQAEVDLRVWADISLVFMVLPLMMLFIIKLGILIALVVLLGRAGEPIQRTLRKLNDITHKSSRILMKVLGIFNHGVIKAATIASLLGKK